MNRALTGVLIGLCASTSLLLSFSDSFTATDGEVYYGIATFNGLWVLDGSVDHTQKDKDKFKIQFPHDLLHAFVTLLAFLLLRCLIRIWSSASIQRHQGWQNPFLLRFLLVWQSFAIGLCDGLLECLDTSKNFPFPCSRRIRHRHFLDTRTN